MKLWQRIVLGLGAAAMLAGCGVPSINPLVGKGDAVQDDRIVGEWDFVPEPGGGSDKFVLGVEKSGAEYKAVLTKNPGEPGKKDEKNTWRTVATLTRIGGELYADLERDSADEAAPCTLDVHVPARLSVSGDVLGIAWIQDKGLRAILGKDPKAIAHVNRENASVFTADSLITASTADLRSFLEKHAKDPDLIGDESHWKRRASAKP